jgi:hypothetical protein
MVYLEAWLLVAAAAGLGGVGLVFLTRSIRTRWLKWLLRVLPPVLMLMPAPVPGFPGNYAPAFVVLVFEGLFQSEGSVAAALTILITATVLTVLLTVLLLRRISTQNKP